MSKNIKERGRAEKRGEGAGGVEEKLDFLLVAVVERREEQRRGGEGAEGG